MSTIVRIFEVEFARDGKGRLGGGSTIYGGDIDISKIASEARTLGEVLEQIQTKAKSFHDNLESVNMSAADFSLKFSDAQKHLDQFTTAAVNMTEEMRKTITLWQNNRNAACII